MQSGQESIERFGTANRLISRANTGCQPYSPRETHQSEAAMSEPAKSSASYPCRMKDLATLKDKIIDKSSDLAGRRISRRRSKKPIKFAQ